MLTMGSSRGERHLLLRLSDRPLLIAHRGASGSAPESTKAAILRAVALQVDMIELDVQLTQDRRLVIFHDERLERTSDGHGRLADWRYRGLARLDSGAWFAPRFAGERILLASTVLSMVPPRCLINLELKTTGRGEILVDRVCSILRRADAEDRVLVSSFDHSLLRLVRSRRRNLATALLCRHRPRHALRRAIELGCISLHLHHSLVTAPLIRRVHEAGLRACAWTIDTPAHARRLLKLGLDGVFTNWPERLGPACRSAVEPHPAQAGWHHQPSPPGRHPAQSPTPPRRGGLNGGVQGTRQ